MTATPEGPGSKDKDAIDAEFAALMQGLSFDDSILASASEEPRAEADPNEPTPIAIVATPLASAKVLAGVIRLALAAEDDSIQLPAGTFTAESETGAIAVGNLSEDDAHTLAHVASLGLQRQGIVMFWRKGDRMIAARYRNGNNEGETPPALVLGALASDVEELLLGVLSLDELGETYNPATLSREEALAWIAGGNKK